MIVVDASVVVEATVAVDAAAIRARLAAEDLAAPDLVDMEFAAALRGLWLGRKLDDARLDRAVTAFVRLRIQRHPSTYLIPRVMDLRANLTSYDAAYVALAELLGCPLLTRDRRLSRAPGVRCAIEVL